MVNKRNKSIMYIVLCFIILVFVIKFIRSIKTDKSINDILNRWQPDIQLSNYVVKDYTKSKSGWYGERLTIITLESKSALKDEEYKTKTPPSGFIDDVLNVQEQFGIYKISSYELMNLKGWEKRIKKKYSNSAEQYNDEFYMVIDINGNKKGKYYEKVYLIENLNVLDMERYRN